MSVNELLIEIRKLQDQKQTLSAEVNSATQAALEAYDRVKASYNDRNDPPYNADGQNFADKQAYTNYLRSRYNTAMYQRRVLQNQLNDVTRQISQLEQQINETRTDQGTGVTALTLRNGDVVAVSSQSQIENLLDQGRISEAQAETARSALTESQRGQPVAKARADQGPGTVSAGEIVLEDSRARGESATYQAPPLPQGSSQPINEETLGESNAVPSVLPQPTPLSPPAALPPGGDPDLAAQARPEPSVTTSSGVDSLETYLPSSTTVNYIYKATLCVSKFSKGRFTQDLEGVLLTFPGQDIGKDTGTFQTSATVDSARESQTPNATNNRAGTGTQANPQTTSVGSSNGISYQGTPTGTTQGVVKPAAVDASQSGDPTATRGSINPRTLAPAATATPPTSDSQPVGLQAPPAVGTNSADVSIQVFLTNGSVRTATTEAQIQELFIQGQITALERTQAINGLQIKQRSAQSSSTNTVPQRIVKDDNGG
jgi:hypothetical protein